MQARKCNILIHKSNNENIGKCVYEHEIPILREIFGHGQVVVDGNYLDKSMPEGHPVEELDHDTEYNRLEFTYGMHAEFKKSVTQEVYGRIEKMELAEYFVKNPSPDTGAEPPWETPSSNGAPKPKEAELKPLVERDRAGIKQFFDSINFKYFKGDNKEKLLEKYNAHLKKTADEADKKLKDSELEPVTV